MEAAGGLDMPEAGRATAIALDFSAGEPSSLTPAKVPRRIRRRLLECRSSPPSSVDEIEAKLKEAELRRRQFHEWLSRKARPKPRSPSWSSQEDLGQRLEAKLNAAEQKRLNLLANAQMRLARLDELRQAAKCGAEMRFEKQREELGSRVEFRVQQAEANRMQLHKAHMQKRAAVRERKARSLLQRTARENTYKESIRSAISQKRSAAERKRMVLLEAEKSRAQARVMQARRVAKIVCCRRESESRKKKEQLESRLQRAKRQRAELLRLRSNAHNAAAHVNLIKYGDLLSRKLAWCWRQFVKCKRTTFALAQEYMTLGINEKSVKSMPFEQLAHLIESTTTLKTVKALLDRFEIRFLLHKPAGSSFPENIDHLLKRLSSPRKRSPPGKRSRAKDNKCSSGVSSSGAGKLSRYPVRAVLCAYMILGHPNAVFSEHGEREVALSRAAADLTREFELLIKVILDGANSVLMLKHPSPGVLFHDLETHKQSTTQSPSEKTFKNQLSIFDAVWRSYLYCFVVWKVKDARLLEDDLVRAACQLELSMMQTCKLNFEGETHNLSYDMRAIQKQVIEDQKLIREKVEHLCGNEGLRRMECALSETRSKFFEAKGSFTHLIGHVAQLSSPNSSSSSVKPVDPVSKEHCIEKRGSSSNVARSLFGRTSLPPFPCSQSNSTVAGQLASENELLVNEIVHNGQSSFANDLDIETTYRSGIKEKVKVAMEKAFWDGVMQSMKEDSPDYDRIIGLVKEVRDELSEMAPLSWKQEIHDNIDIDILSQVMEFGTRDRDHLGRILGYALLTLRKLSAPANENDLKNSHEKLLNELASNEQSVDEKESSFAISMIKGLRFVLDQIQTLKKEISKARIQMIEPIIKGSAGLEYLQKAFHDRYGPSSVAVDTLPLTKLWLSPLKNIADEEWNDYVDSISLLPESHTLPLTSLRTGGKLLQAHVRPLHPTEKPGAVDGQLKCTGEKLDVLLRLGLLRLASSVEGLIPDTIPETLKLNLLRLRSLQSQLQQIIVISTSMLVLRQIVISDGLSLSLSELDPIISTSVNNLLKLLDKVPDVSIEEIVETIAKSFPEEEDKLPSRKQLMARLVMKSLENDDPVFTKVSRSIYLATRAVLFAGNGPRGCRLAQGILQKVGAVMLLDRVVRVAEVLIIMANVSLQVHGSWYQFLV